MAEQPEKGEFFDKERWGRGAVATAESIEEGDTVNVESFCSIVEETPNDDFVSFKMESSGSGESDIGYCDIIKGRRLRANNSEDQVAYHRNFGTSARRTTLTESANPMKILNDTTTIANTAREAALATLDIVNGIKDTTRDLRSRARLLDTACRTSHMPDKGNYRVIANEYRVHAFDAEKARRDAQKAFGALIGTLLKAKDIAKMLSEKINMGSTKTEVLEEAATIAIADVDKATKLCYDQRYLALVTLQKCKEDLLNPVFPTCKCPRCDIKCSPGDLLIPILIIGGCLCLVWAMFDSPGTSYHLKLGLGLFLLGVTPVYALYKLCCWTRKIRTSLKKIF